MVEMMLPRRCLLPAELLLIRTHGPPGTVLKQYTTFFQIPFQFWLQIQMAAAVTIVISLHNLHLSSLTLQNPNTTEVTTSVVLVLPMGMRSFTFQGDHLHTV